MVYPSKYDQIVKAAFEIFSHNGFFSTSMEDVMQVANVSRRTMYNHFSSKNILIEKVIRYYRVDYENNLEKYYKKKKAHTPQLKLNALFDYSLTWYNSKIFNGCMAVHAISEYSEKDDNIIKACHDFKDWQYNSIKSLIDDIGYKDTDKLAYQIFVVMEGLTVVAERSQSFHSADPVTILKKLITGHLKADNTIPHN